MPKSVIIIGCGLGGATLAISLLQRGFKVRIYEQAPALQELGAGLTLPVSSMRSYDSLGLFDRVRDITIRQGGMTYVHYQTGEVLTGVEDPDWTHKPETPEQSGHTHRALLHLMLVETIRELDPDALIVNHRLKSFVQDDKGVHAEFENGETATADTLVGCDGLHSVAHRIMFGEAKPTFTGVVAFRSTIPVEDVKPFLSGGRASNFVGPRRGFLRYGVKNGTMLNCVGLAKTDAFQTEGWDNRSSREEMLEMYGQFHPNVIGIINGAPKEGFFKWALYDRAPAAKWTLGRATLLGDAAHPMLPYLGQGATQAIEDAVVLGRCMEAYDDYTDAFAAYEKARIDRTSRIVLASRDQGAALNQEDPYQYASLKVDGSVLGNYDAGRVAI